VIHFTVSPIAANYSNCTTNPAVPLATLTLDNSQSTLAVSWQATAVETVSGEPWATISAVTSGTVAAGGTQSITVSPAPSLCQSSPPPGAQWHVSITTANAGTFTFTYSVV
jgi:hypothetical protein